MPELGEDLEPPSEDSYTGLIALVMITNKITTREFFRLLPLFSGN